jgi:hypothetical protein
VDSGIGKRIHFWWHKRCKEAWRHQAPMMVGEFGLGEDKPGAQLACGLATG